MSRLKVVGSVAAGALGLAALAGLPYVRGLGRSTDVPVATARRGDIARHVQAEGNLKAVKATVLTAPIDGANSLKIAWLAPDGSRVRTDDVVIRFDSTDAEKSLVDGEGERQTADNRIAGKRAEGEGTLRNLDRDAGMAGLDLRYAREFQSKDPEIFSRTEIIESQLDESLATRRKENAEAVRGIRDKLTRVDLDLLGIERHKADLKIEQAKKGLTSLEVRAPHDGILVFTEEGNGIPKVGDTVWRGQPLAEIPRMDAMEAEVYVLEADAGGLAVGLPAEVTIESRADRSFKAKVAKVDTLAKPRVSGVPVQYFGVTLELERTDPMIMKPGQRVRAMLALDARKGAISVPREAVLEKGGKKLVYRRSGFGFEPVEVALGPAALGRVVIEKGLGEGDVVALRDPTRPAGETVPERGAREASAAPSAGGPR
ncbi:MAG: HlyD family efflux transporter periplasmic adaptor subunit [Acidobacteriia bacterium]|nr:HlyD family efflux transporter periplasmic adaptor subunit [Terriglobia bacterium]